MAGNVSIVNVGTTEEEKKALLCGVGVNASTVKCVLEEPKIPGYETHPSPIVAPLAQEAVMVARPSMPAQYAEPEKTPVTQPTVTKV